MFICHCYDCRAQSASAFGTSAIFPRFDLPKLTPALGVHTRTSDGGNVKDCYFCPKCGVRICHMTRGKGEVSIKGGCIQGLSWDGAVHIWTKRAVVPIPDDAEQWEEEPLS